MSALKNSRPISILILAIGILTLNSCKTEGCTDPRANNFIYEADKDDGSCDYGGCTNEDALNYNSRAEYDNGTCKYNGDARIVTTLNNVGGNTAMIVHVNGQYIGMLQSKCTSQNPSCNSPCQSLPYLDKSEGLRSLRYWIVRQTSSTKIDTIYSSSAQTLQIIGSECTIHVIE